jgi:hypothetical protein
VDCGVIDCPVHYCAPTATPTEEDAVRHGFQTPHGVIRKQQKSTRLCPATDQEQDEWIELPTADLLLHGNSDTG